MGEGRGRARRREGERPNKGGGKTGERGWGMERREEGRLGQCLYV